MKPSQSFIPKKTISFIVVILFVIQVIVPSTFAQNLVTSEPFDPNSYYDIVSNANIYGSIPGSSLAWIGEELQILINGGIILLSKQNIEQIRKVNGLVNNTVSADHKPKRNTFTGLAIGAGVGAVAGITTGLLLSNSGKGSCEDTSECDALSDGIGAVIGAGIFVSSALIGLVVGAVTERKEKSKE